MEVSESLLQCSLRRGSPLGSLIVLMIAFAARAVQDVHAVDFKQEAINLCVLTCGSMLLQASDRETFLSWCRHFPQLHQQEAYDLVGHLQVSSPLGM